MVLKTWNVGFDIIIFLISKSQYIYVMMSCVYLYIYIYMYVYIWDDIREWSDDTIILKQMMYMINGGYEPIYNWVGTTLHIMYIIWHWGGWWDDVYSNYNHL